MEVRRQSRFAEHHLRMILAGIALLAVAYTLRPTRSDAQGQAAAGSPFVQSPADPGALQLKDLSAAEQAGVKATGTELGKLNLAPWSQYTDLMVRQAQAKRAEYEAGLAGYLEGGAR